MNSIKTYRAAVEWIFTQATHTQARAYVHRTYTSTWLDDEKLLEQAVWLIKDDQSDVIKRATRSRTQNSIFSGLAIKYHRGKYSGSCFNLLM